MFIHLHCHSPFSFLDGASSIEQLVAQAHLQKMPALALTDHNTVAGLPAFHRWAAVYGVKPISGAEVTLMDGAHLTLLAATASGYANLCKLLTQAHAGAGRRLDPRLSEAALFHHREGLLVLSGCWRGPVARALLRGDRAAAEAVARRYRENFADAFYLEVHADDYPFSRRLMRALADLGEHLRIPLVATGNVHYHQPDRFPVHDILTCVRLGCDVRVPHADRPLNDKRWLFDEAEAKRRFAQLPASAIANTMKIAEQCEVVLRLHDALFPAFPLPSGVSSASAFLRTLVFRGARDRFGRVDRHLQNRLEHELNIIEQLGYVDYFLVVWDIVRHARSRGIRCVGRGSAADSAVAFCLYLTDVDAAGRGLLFERFMSLERAEKPDIDIDFDSRRRDEVISYVYEKYGAEHVARVATYQTFRGRSAIRDIGAALGLPADLLDALAKRVPWMTHADRLEHALAEVPELKGFSDFQSAFRWLHRLAAAVAGFPRHFGMHLGGLVISRRPLLETTPLQPSAKGEWMTPFDKEGVEDVGLVKLDLLSLRTLSAVENTLVLRKQQGKAVNYDSIPLDDTETFDLLSRGDTIGVFQLESPAQRVLQSRLKPKSLEDIVASVALIRPGPIQGNMVDPFLLRRRGEVPITYLHPKLEPILGKTYGVVLFQEQVIEIATAIAHFTPGEADQLRRVMSRARSHAEMEKIGQHFLKKAKAAGVSPDVAEIIFSYIQGYASYGFCEAHAAAFATTAYKTAYLARHYPAEFFASILNQYPMGYYPVHVICAEARRRGIDIRGVDIQRSTWMCTVESPGAIRLGFCRIKGFRESLADTLCRERELRGPYTSVLDCLRRVPALDGLTAERLIRVGAFDGVMDSRRQALWQLPDWLGMRSALPLPVDEERVATAGEVGEFSLAAKLTDEYNLLGVGVSGHWAALLRPHLEKLAYKTAAAMDELPDNTLVKAAGLVVRPHRPPTRSGKTVVFFTLEDETGFVDAVMFEPVYRSGGGAVVFTPLGRWVGMEGTVQRRDKGRAQVVVSRVWPLQHLLTQPAWGDC